MPCQSPSPNEEGVMVCCCWFPLVSLGDALTLCVHSLSAHHSPGSTPLLLSLSSLTGPITSSCCHCSCGSYPPWSWVWSGKLAPLISLRTCVPCQNGQVGRRRGFRKPGPVAGSSFICSLRTASKFLSSSDLSSAFPLLLRSGPWNRRRRRSQLCWRLWESLVIPQTVRRLLAIVGWGLMCIP